MAEAVGTQITEGLKSPKEIVKEPFKAITVMFVVLLLVLILEAFKPGLITGPIKSLLAMVGIGSGT